MNENTNQNTDLNTGLNSDDTAATGMKVLWVSAHPDQRSLTAALRRDGIAALRDQGHQVRESDLYAMGWDPVVRGTDYGDAPSDGPGDEGGEGGERLLVGAASERAHRDGLLSADIRAEQDKITWADTLVLQFPLWWFGMPAIMKGWFDRVFVQGYGFGLHDEQGRTMRYGRGGMAGKRALVVVSAGARESGLTGRGVHGPVDEVLFPILHGTFWYTGMDALHPLLVPSADRLDADGYDRAAHRLRERLTGLPHERPIAYRSEHGGDYGPDLRLRPHLAPGRGGLAVHRDDHDTDQHERDDDRDDDRGGAVEALAGAAS